MQRTKNQLLPIMSSFNAFRLFIEHVTMLERAIFQRRPVLPSVHLSVTLVSHSKTVQNIKTHFAPYDRALFLVS